jgi:hypothetical protein
MNAIRIESVLSKPQRPATSLDRAALARARTVTAWTCSTMTIVRMVIVRTVIVRIRIVLRLKSKVSVGQHDSLIAAITARHHMCCGT